MRLNFAWDGVFILSLAKDRLTGFTFGNLDTIFNLLEKSKADRLKPVLL